MSKKFEALRCVKGEGWRGEYSQGMQFAEGEINAHTTAIFHLIAFVKIPLTPLTRNNSLFEGPASHIDLSWKSSGRNIEINGVCVNPSEDPMDHIFAVSHLLNKKWKPIHVFEREDKALESRLVPSHQSWP